MSTGDSAPKHERAHLLSPHCKLHKLSIRDCTVCTSDRTYQFSSFELQKAYANVSLNATDSCSAINHCLSLLSPYSNQLTDIILNITKQYCSTDETLERIGLYHDEQSNIHTLSFKGGKLSSEATSSLIQSLISPHCKLHTLSMRGGENKSRGASAPPPPLNETLGA